MDNLNTQGYETAENTGIDSVNFNYIEESFYESIN